MTQTPQSTGLLTRVQKRLKITSWAAAFYYSSLIVLGVALISILAVRLLGLVPQAAQEPQWLWAVPAVALISAFVFQRQVAQPTAARAIDQHANTHDLFLTVASLSGSAGDYQPLVADEAEKTAGKIQPTQVVPFQFGRRLSNLAAAAAIMALAVFFVPQLDPFGKVEAAAKQEQQKKEIQAIKVAAKKRKEQLKKVAKRAEDRADEIDNTLEDLKNQFRKMQPTQVKANAKILTNKKKDVGELWKTGAKNEQLRRMMSEPISEQQLSGSRTQKMNDWLKELQEGKTDKLQEALKSAQEKMKEMAEAKTAEERSKIASEMQKELQDLSRFAKDKAGSKELADAINKAMKSLQQAKPKPGEQSEPGEPSDPSQEMEEALEALKESLELSEQELQQVADAAKELKQLEEALETLQKAQQLNQKKQLDGEKCEGCETMADYEDLYDEMMNENPEPGEGGGNGGGFGKGGESEEDDSDPEGYQTEKEKAQVQAGKVLLSIKTKEYATEKDFDPEQARKYKDTVTDLKSSVQSAIETEEVPPGYIKGIKGYFDKIEAVDPKTQSDK